MVPQCVPEEIRSIVDAEVAIRGNPDPCNSISSE
jgi:hypothetical protein